MFHKFHATGLLHNCHFGYFTQLSQFLQCTRNAYKEPVKELYNSGDLALISALVNQKHKYLINEEINGVHVLYTASNILLGPHPDCDPCPKDSMNPCGKSSDSEKQAL